MWFPDWLLRRSDAPSDRATFVAGSRDGRPLVAAANDRAIEAGIEVGMTRRSAEALCPSALVLARDPAAEATRFEPILNAIEDLIPRVEVVEPGWVFVPTDGAVRYYGGERALVDRIAATVERLAPGGHFGVANGPFAAYWAARSGHPTLIVKDEKAFLSGLDISALEIDELIATFRWLGVTTLGELAALPRHAVASRFGTRGLEAHRLAGGEDRMVLPRRIPDDLTVEAIFEEPLMLVEQVGFMARRLAGNLMALLDRHRVAPYQVEVETEAADGVIRSRVWRSAEPFDTRALAERVWWQLRAWIETGGITDGLIRLKLSPTALSDQGYQPGLFEQREVRIETERALERTRTILGPDSVLRARPQGGRDPAERVQWARWGEDFAEPTRSLASPWPGRVPAPSPSLVPPRPRRLEVEWDAEVPTRVRLSTRWEPVLAWAGPWRRLGKWWAEEQPSALYQIVTSAGAMLCRTTDGQTFVVGVYD